MNLKKIQLKIQGMHCKSCEILIERKLRKIEGLHKVNVHLASGKADLYCSRDLSLEEIKEAISDVQYKISFWEDKNQVDHAENANGDFFQISTIFFIILLAYFLLKKFDLLPNFAISDNMSYGFIFMIGLVAAVSSCLAVTGGLLLSLAAKYNEKFPHLSGVKKFKPHIYFNIGRIVSYTLLGGLIGKLGSLFIISPRINGILVIMISFVMISMGFRLLKLFPSLSLFHIPMPKFLAHKIHDSVDSESKAAPFMLGAGTFFLPCGFTQALQLYVISQGDFKIGALTMFFFSLGTLPSLVGLGAVSSFAKGEMQKVFLKFVGALVILLGIFNLNSGLNLTGISLASILQNTKNTEIITKAEPIEIVNGKQIVKMKVRGLNYSPSNFTITKDVPVEWQIDGREAGGCAQVLIVPTLGITEYLSSDSITTITFTPKKIGTIPFSCSMGMTTSGAAFEVVDNI